LDVATIENGELAIKGWAASYDAGPVEGFRITYAGHVFTDFPALCGLPSPDVYAAHPKLDQAGNSRFRLLVPLRGVVPEPPPPSVILVTPLLSGGREGTALLTVWGASLPLPSADDQVRVGHGDFLAQANIFLKEFVEKAGLQPNEDVLDVGCGVGRMAYSLAYYLAPTARYEGFDIVEDLIDWCRQTVTPRFGNFHFRFADIHNPRYNPQGDIQANEYVFPYADKSFDFVFLTSVFTHLRAPEVRHYLDEIYRVLRPGGRCLFTAFLLNDESAQLMRAGKSTLDIAHPVGEGYTANPAIPESAMGFDEQPLAGWVTARGFRIGATYYGSWPGRARYSSYQDMMVVHKPD
jgi:ubiquinone/menaquinone biosynthesis C-methylase UbiE